MKTKTVQTFLLAAAFSLSTLNTSYSQLTATVQPGYVFAPGERPTTATLNQLGQPTISIAGTVTGTVGLGAGTVTGTHLANSVPDNVTISFNTSSPRQLQIVPQVGGSGGGVSTNQINSNVCGPGLAGGSGSQLYVTNVGASQLLLTTNTLVAGVVSGTNQTVPGSEVALGAGLGIVGGALVVTNYANLVTNGGPGGSVKFTSSEQTLATGTTTLAHSLAGVPQVVRWVLVCKTAELGFSVADEVDVMSVATSTGSADQQAYQSTANATSVILHANNDNVAVRRNDTGGLVSITPGNWKLKCYALYFP